MERTNKGMGTMGNVISGDYPAPKTNEPTPKPTKAPKTDTPAE